MNKKYFLLILLALLLPLGLRTQKSPQDMDRFSDNLLKRMTLEEKIGQLNLPVTGEAATGQTKSSDIATKIERGEVDGFFSLKGVDRIRDIRRLTVEDSRLGTPLFLGMDVVHGYETILPIPLGFSHTWDIPAIEESARTAAIGANADGIPQAFSPMVDISRNPHWGWVSEDSGEDLFLGTQIAQTMVCGYRGKNMRRNDEIMTCTRHFVLYEATEAGRDYNTVDMNRQQVFNDYMLPYQTSVEVGADSIMASFNKVGGVSTTANRWLMADALRRAWGFNRFVVTDFTGIPEVVEHRAGDLQTVSAHAVNVGVDMGMVSGGFVGTLRKSIEEGKVSVEAINTVYRRILEARYKLGLFGNPYKYRDLRRPAHSISTKERRAVARRIAGENSILLKNGRLSPGPFPLLPLSPIGAIAVTGSSANARSNMPGTWSATAVLDKSPSLIEGLVEWVGNQAKILCAKGSNLINDAAYEERATLFGRSSSRGNRTDKQLLDETLKTALQSGVITTALDESSEMGGENSSRTNLDLPDIQHTFLGALLKAGKSVILILLTGRPSVLNWKQENIPATLNVWFGGSEAGLTIGDVLFGAVNPSGKFAITFPKNVDQIPLYYTHRDIGRPLKEGKWFERFRSNYLDVDNGVLYPLGYELPYITFRSSDIVLGQPSIGMDNQLVASVTVINTGDCAGSKIVQLYTRDLVDNVTRPVRELKGSEKVHLQPDESCTVRFTIAPGMLKSYNANLQFVVGPGDFDVMVRSDGQNVKTTQFMLR